MVSIVNKIEAVRNGWIETTIDKNDTSIVQILLKSKNRQNLGYTKAGEKNLPFVSGTIVAIFRIKPFTGNIL